MVPDWTSQGTDDLTQTTENISATLIGHERVQACGRLVDAWRVQATGTPDSPTQQINLTLDYAIATEYGGIPVRDTVQMSGMDSYRTLNSKNTATIDRVPAVMKPPACSGWPC